MEATIPCTHFQPRKILLKFQAVNIMSENKITLIHISSLLFSHAYLHAYIQFFFFFLTMSVGFGRWVEGGSLKGKKNSLSMRTMFSYPRLPIFLDFLFCILIAICGTDGKPYRMKSRHLWPFAVELPAFLSHTLYAVTKHFSLTCMQ